MRSSLYIFFIIFLSFHANAQTPKINNFTPSLGEIGSMVTIKGSNFNINTNENVVYFGAVKANVIDAYTDSLHVLVPPGGNFEPITVTVNGQTASSQLPFNIIFPGADSSFSTNSFSESVEFQTSSLFQSKCFADFNGDGKSDLVVYLLGARNENSKIGVFRNTSIGEYISFEPEQQYELPGQIPYGQNPFYATGYNIKAIDLNGDGMKDIVVSFAAHHTLCVFINESVDGNIIFGPRQDIETTLDAPKVSFGDIDGDGKPDMVLSSIKENGYNFYIDNNIYITPADFAKNYVTIYKNTSANGIIVFDSSLSLFSDTCIYSAELADIDGDGKIDLLSYEGAYYGTNSMYPSNTTGKIKIFRNIGNNEIRFDSALSINIPTPMRQVENHFIIADFNNDKKPDLAVPDYTSDIPVQDYWLGAGNTITIYTNNSSLGNISLVKGPQLTCGSPVSYFWSDFIINATSGDLNGDGKPDLVAVKTDLRNNVRGWGTYLFVFRNTTEDTLSFDRPVIYETGGNFGGDCVVGPILCDINADGKFDILTPNFNNLSPNYGNGGFSIFKNRSNEPFIDSININKNTVVSLTTQRSFVFHNSATNRQQISGVTSKVVVRGQRFLGASSVTFDSVEVISFSVDSATKITAYVDSSLAASRKIMVTTPLGIATLPVANIASTSTVCINSDSCRFVIKGENGVAPYRFIYKLSNKPAEETIVSSSGDSAIITTSIITPGIITPGVITCSLISVTDVYGNKQKINKASVVKIINSVPQIPPGIVAVKTVACPNDTILFSIRNTVANASYNAWNIIGSGAIIITDNIGMSIKVAFNDNFIDSCRININAVNDCGISLPQSVTIKRQIPYAYSSVVTQTLVDNTCGDRIYRYTSGKVAKAIGYNWIIPETLGGISGVIVDSGNINASSIIRLRYASNAAALLTDSIKIIAYSACGSSSAKAFKLTNTALTAPVAPLSLTVTPIVTNVCGNRIFRYSVPNLPIGTTGVAPATGYLWSFTGALGSNAVIDSGTLTSQVIRVLYTSNVAAVVGDSVSVRYTSLCGFGMSKNIKLTNVSLNPPVAPLSIKITAVSPSVCGAKVYSYAAPAITTALATGTATVAPVTGYQWSFTGLGTTASIDSGDVNSQVIRVSYTSNSAAAVGDSVRVAYTSLCGNSLNKSAKLTNITSTVPATPASIIITAISTTVCGNKKYRYSAPALPAGTATAAAASGYVWSFTNSSLGNNAHIDSGDVNSQKIVVSYTLNSDAAAGDSVNLYYTSTCGNSATKALKLTNTLLTAPLTPASVTITLVKDSCGARIYRYTATVLPIATATAMAANGYEWSLPTGSAVATSATLDSGVMSGANARYIRLKFTNNAAAGANDSIRVRYTSGCGASKAKAHKLSNVAATTLAASATLTGTTSICSIVGTSTVARYTASVVSGAVCYLWTLPSGAVIDSGSNGLKIKVQYITAGPYDSMFVQAVGTIGCTGAKKVLKLVSTGCASLPTSRVVNPAITSTEESMDVIVYPNPTTSSYQLFVKYSKLSQMVKARILDLQGRVLKLLTFNSNETIAFGNELKTGVYMVEVSEGDKVKTVRVVKY
jgi:hypothetical protein